jgi:flagellar hook-associated protein 2
MATSINGLASTGLSANGTGSGTGTGGFTGLGQGINVNQFVQLALAFDQANITNLQNQQTGIAAESSALATITSNLTALRSAANALNDPFGVLASETATSSNSNVLTATAASTAVAGTHTIAVTSLATTSSFYSGAVATSSTALATGDTISISAGGTSVASVTVDSTNNTLDKIAAAINTQTTAVRASVINDANGARLAFVSTATGAPGDLAVTGSLHRIDNTAINFTQAVPGLNAVLTVDGVPISSASNTVSGVISGVTLTLAAPTGGTPVTLAVAPNTSSITAALNQFVSTYNTAITAINRQFQVSPNGTGGGALEGDGSLRDAQVALLGAVSYAVTGSGAPVNLTNLGINTNDDGTLSVDSGALSSALSSNFSGVKSFLQTTSTGFAANLGTALNRLSGPGGSLALDAQGFTSSSLAFTQKITDLQSALAVKQQNLIAVYAQVNVTLQELPLLQAQLSQQLATA